MDDQEIHSLQNSITPTPLLLETHISWVLKGSDCTYKIKKPIHLSFLDYSTLGKRKLYCKREVKLNRRFSPQMYLGVSSIHKTHSSWEIKDDSNSSNSKSAYEYAVRMKTMNTETQMDKLLREGRVTEHQIEKLARVIAQFHVNAEIINKFELSEMVRDFNDILNYASLFTKNEVSTILNLVNGSDRFIKHNKECIMKRKSDGFIRDLHGDLHPGNVFLLDTPVLFDCIEFSDHLRQIDIFAEIGFFLMDLEYYGYSNFENTFINIYQKKIPAFKTKNDIALLKYYKMYRANVKAKVFAIRYNETGEPSDQKAYSDYLSLALSYKDQIFSN